MNITYPAGIQVDAETKERTERFFELVGESNISSDDKAELLALIPRICLEACVKYGPTALIHAARGGDSEVIETLLKAGADIEARDQNGWTALIWAAGNEHVKAVETLLEAGADIEARNSHGYTALTNTAYRGGDIEVVKTLLRAGANIYAQNKVGETVINERKFLRETTIQWKQQYESFVANCTAPKSAEDVYHLLAVYPLIDPKAPVDRETHLRQIFSYAKWPDKERPREIIKQLREDGAVSAALAESLLAMMQPARASILGKHGRGR